MENGPNEVSVQKHHKIHYIIYVFVQKSNIFHQKSIFKVPDSLSKIIKNLSPYLQGFREKIKSIFNISN